MAVIISQPQRRLLVFASAAFFLLSVYYCTTRLFFVDYKPEQAPYTSEQHEKPKEPVVDLDVDIQFELSKADMPMSYGTYGRPKFDNITLLGALPDKYVPSRWNRRRLIVIGDIHGMLDPLNRLLEQVNYDSSRDHIISVGDMVNKGPDSAAVVSRLMSLGASAVRGNHEDRVLLAFDAMNARQGIEAELATPDAEAHRGESLDLKTARSLSPEQLAWIQSLPVVLSIDPFHMYVVHAGLVPGLVLDQQDPWACMNMRTFRYPREEFRKKEEEKKKKEEEKKKQKEEEERKKKEEERKKKEEEETKKKEEEGRAQLEAQEKASDDTLEPHVRRAEAPIPADATAPEVKAQPLVLTDLTTDDHDVWIPTDSHDGDRWTDVWNREQARLAPADRRVVVYGHDAKIGYHEDDYTFGIDSACVKGGMLSAFVVEADSSNLWRHTTVQVPCTEPSSE